MLSEGHDFLTCKNLVVGSHENPADENSGLVTGILGRLFQACSSCVVYVLVWKGFLV